MNTNIQNIQWNTSPTTIYGTACFGIIVIDLQTIIAEIHTMAGIKKWYPSISKSLYNDELKIEELLNRLNNYHLNQIQMILNTWTT